jgi:hypothetical protein
MEEVVRRRRSRSPTRPARVASPVCSDKRRERETSKRNASRDDDYHGTDGASSTGVKYLAFLFLAACAPAVSTTTTTGAPQNEAISRLERERDDANRRADAIARNAAADRGKCDLASHELESLRARNTFEQAIWLRLDSAEVTRASLEGMRATAATADQKKTIDRALKDAAPLEAFVEKSLRRVHVTSDVEWPRYGAEVEAAMNDLERALHPIL